MVYERKGIYITEYVSVSCLLLSEELYFNECDLCLMEIHVLREHRRQILHANQVIKECFL